MKFNNDKYQNFKLDLGRLLGNEGLELMSKDYDILDRIFNLLTENKNVEKIEGIISSTEIIKYGGDISENRANEIYEQILDWWDSQKSHF